MPSPLVSYFSYYNSDFSTYSQQYKDFLKQFFLAQIDSFESGLFSFDVVAICNYQQETRLCPVCDIYNLGILQLIYFFHSLFILFCNILKSTIWLSYLKRMKEQFWSFNKYKNNHLLKNKRIKNFKNCLLSLRLFGSARLLQVYSYE